MFASRKILALAILLCLLAPTAALALDTGLEQTTATGLGTTDIRIVIGRIIQVALGMLGIVALLITLAGGYLWMTSGGDTERIGRAKALLASGMIGLIIILSAFAITTFVLNRILCATGNCPGVTTKPPENACGQMPLGWPEQCSLCVANYWEWDYADASCQQMPPCVDEPGEQPTVCSIDPQHHSAGHYVTIHGFDFGAFDETTSKIFLQESQGTRYQLKIVACGAASTWKSESVVAELTTLDNTPIPDGVQYQVVAANAVGESRNQDRIFRMDPPSDTPSPDLACVVPDSGHENDGVLVMGKNLGTLKCDTYPNCQNGSALTFAGSAGRIFASQEDSRTDTEVRVRVPAGAITSRLGIIAQTFAAGTVLPQSNSLEFNVTCDQDSQCSVTNCCSANSCSISSACTAPPPPPPGQSCDADITSSSCQPGACAAAQICDGSKNCTCQPAVGAACDTDSATAECNPGDCATGLFCDGGKGCTCQPDRTEGQACANAAPGSGQCTTNGTCAAGLACDTSCTCRAKPRIDGLSPENGSFATHQGVVNGATRMVYDGGDFVTVFGAHFGTTAGKVFFSGQSGPVEARIPTQCSRSGAWQDGQIIVEVPQDAQDGPLTVQTAEGVEVVSGKNFDVRQDPLRPGLCAVAPNHALAGEKITAPESCSPAAGCNPTDYGISGVRFGEETNQRAPSGSSVRLGDLAANVAQAVWTDERIDAAAVPDASGQTLNMAVVKTVNGTELSSNSVRFTIETATVNPVQISEYTPHAGPVGTYVEIKGSGFGTAGEVWFSLPGDPTNHIVASTSFPPLCLDNFWQDGFIRVKVPVEVTLAEGVSAETYQLRVHAAAGDSAPVEFTVNNNPLGPQVCYLQPEGGPAGTPITIGGEQFGDFVAGNEVFLQTNTARAVASVANTATNWQPQQITATIPQTMIRGGESLALADGRYDLFVRAGLDSLPKSFAVGSCFTGSLSCTAAQSCCVPGFCSTQCGSKTSNYAWRFTTSDAKPRVVQYSPPEGIYNMATDEVGDVRVRFDQEMDPTSFILDNGTGVDPTVVIRICRGAYTGTTCENEDWATITGDGSQEYIEPTYDGSAACQLTPSQSGTVSCQLIPGQNGADANGFCQNGDGCTCVLNGVEECKVSQGNKSCMQQITDNNGRCWLNGGCDCKQNDAVVCHVDRWGKSCLPAGSSARIDGFTVTKIPELPDSISAALLQNRGLLAQAIVTGQVKSKNGFLLDGLNYHYSAAPGEDQNSFRWSIELKVGQGCMLVEDDGPQCLENIACSFGGDVAGSCGVAAGSSCTCCCNAGQSLPAAAPGCAPLQCDGDAECGAQVNNVDDPNKGIFSGCSNADVCCPAGNICTDENRCLSFYKPANLQALTLSDHEVKLTWYNPNPSGLVNIVAIERRLASESDSQFTEIKRISGGATGTAEYTLDDQAAVTAYVYRAAFVHITALPPGIVPDGNSIPLLPVGQTQYPSESKTAYSDQASATTSCADNVQCSTGCCKKASSSSFDPSTPQLGQCVAAEVCAVVSSCAADSVTYNPAQGKYAGSCAGVNPCCDAGVGACKPFVTDAQGNVVCSAPGTKLSNASTFTLLPGSSACVTCLLSITPNRGLPRTAVTLAGTGFGGLRNAAGPTGVRENASDAVVFTDDRQAPVSSWKNFNATPANHQSAGTTDLILAEVPLRSETGGVYIHRVIAGESCVSNPLPFTVHATEAPQVVFDGQCRAEDGVTPSPNPQPGQTDICVNSLLDVRFSRPLSSASVRGVGVSKTVVLEKCGEVVCGRNGGACALAGNASCQEVFSSLRLYLSNNDQTLRIDPQSGSTHANLEPNTWYRLTLREKDPNAAFDCANYICDRDYEQSLIGQNSWFFKTQNSAEVCRATGVLVSPRLAGLNVLNQLLPGGYAADKLGPACQILAANPADTWSWRGAWKTSDPDGSRATIAQRRAPDTDRADATARAETGAEPVKVFARVTEPAAGSQPAATKEGFARLFINFNQLNVLQFFPPDDCQTVCTNALVAVNFDRQILPVQLQNRQVYVVKQDAVGDGIADGENMVASLQVVGSRLTVVVHDSSGRQNMLDPNSDYIVALRTGAGGILGASNEQMYVPGGRSATYNLSCTGTGCGTGQFFSWSFTTGNQECAVSSLGVTPAIARTWLGQYQDFVATTYASQSCNAGKQAIVPSGGVYSWQTVGNTSIDGTYPTSTASCADVTAWGSGSAVGRVEETTRPDIESVQAIGPGQTQVCAAFTYEQASYAQATQGEFNGGVYHDTDEDADTTKYNQGVVMNAAGLAQGHGAYLSPVIDSGKVRDWGKLSWDAVYPASRAAGYHFNALAADGTYPSFAQNTNPLGCTGNTCPTLDTNGRYGSAVRFDGENDYLQVQGIPQGFPLGNSARSLTAWIKLDEQHVRRALHAVLTWGPAANNSAFWVQIDESSGVNKLAAGFFGNDLIPDVALDYSWHHIAVTYDATTLKLYIDGLLVGQKSIAGVNTQMTAVFVGLDNFGQSNYFDGWIDELAVYSEALTPQTIARQYQTGSNYIQMQVAACDDSVCADDRFVGPDGTPQTTYSDELSVGGLSNTVLLQNLPRSRYFRYRAAFVKDEVNSSRTLTRVEATAPLVPASPDLTPQDVGPFTGGAQLQVGYCNSDEECVKVNGINQCTGSRCINHQCTPVIKGVDPADGAPGTWVTIRGCYFGMSQGEVQFSAPNVRDPGVPSRWPTTVTPQCSVNWSDSIIVTEVPFARLVAHYTMEDTTETMADHSGQGLDGSVDTTAGWTAGKNGGGLAFGPGKTLRAEVKNPDELTSSPDEFVFGTGTFTIETWAKFGRQGNRVATIMDKGDWRLNIVSSGKRLIDLPFNAPTSPSQNAGTAGAAGNANLQPVGQTAPVGFTSAGKFGGALDFIGNGAYAQIPGGTVVFGQDTFAVEFWLKTKSGDGGTIVSQEGSVNGGMGWDISLTGDGHLQWNLHGDGGIPACSATAACANGYACVNGQCSVGFAAAGAKVNDDVWHHVVYMVPRSAEFADQATGWWIIDGVLAGQDTWPQADLLGDKPVLIGHRAGSPKLTAQLDEVQLYVYGADEPLPSSDMLIQRREDRSAILTDGLLQFWMQDEPSGISSIALDDDQWHHLAVVRTGPLSGIVYVDGAVVDNDPPPAGATPEDAPNFSATQPLVFGQIFAGTQGFTGVVDEVKIFTGAVRSQADVRNDAGL